MKRRSALKNIGLIAGGIILFPSCNYSEPAASIALKNLNINITEGYLLKQIVDTILPEGEIPGGVALNVHNFIWVIINDCTKEEDQNTFINGLRLFNQAIFNLTDKKFGELSPDERLTSLKSLFEDKSTNEDILEFIDSTKQIAIKGYMNSEYILTEQMPYKLVPGAFSYEPCKSINPNEKVNINA
ncbi:MAG: gluconate 2-dehydrogenase subunit 3 family protein [Flavobacteriaceae bacterium]|nr:gluconate 2-dehydrogenase subunit 3 family protein [Flavobacteriaceae bacterium]